MSDGSAEGKLMAVWPREVVRARASTDGCSSHVLRENPVVSCEYVRISCSLVCLARDIPVFGRGSRGMHLGTAYQASALRVSGHDPRADIQHRGNTTVENSNST